MRTRHFVILLAGIPLASSGQAAEKYCESSPAVREELKQLDLKARKVTGANRLEALKRLAEEAVARHPDDFFVHLRSQQLVRSRKQRERQALIDRYKALADQHPKDPKYAVLYARALLGANTPLAIEVLKKAAAGEADPQVHLALADVYSYGKFADRAQTRAQLDAYFAACPASLDDRALSLLTRYGAPETIAKQAAALRERLTTETDPDLLRSWEHAWNLEFKARPVQEHEALRKQIAADLERLETISTSKDDRWAGFLVSGYRMAGEPEALRHAEDRLIADYPASFAARNAVRERWRKEHPYPKSEDPEEKKQAFYRAQLAWAEEQLQRAPGEFEYLMERFRALDDLNDSTGEQVAAAGNAMLEALRKGADWYSVPPFEFQVARALLKKKAEVERVPDLVAEGLRGFRKREGDTQDDRVPDERRDPDSGNAFYVKTETARILIEAAKLLKKPEIAASAVAEVESIKAEKALSYILVLRARFAEVEGRKLDALLLYRAAIDARPADFRPPKKDELADNIARLWKELGGTAATKDLWERKDRKVQVAEGGGRWETPKKEMPKWELSDLAGQTWKLASLEGKTLFINLWATWCGPCRSEHSYLEKLYQKTKGRTDIQVLSFNVDDEVGAVAPYIKENSYTFPVLLASSYVNDLLPYISIPRNWIVDAAGKWRLEQIGFGSGENWEKDVLEKIEQTKPEANAATPRP